MEQLQEIYCHYTEELEKVKKNASGLAGVFGLPGGPKDHPCHAEFYSSVGQWVENFLAARPDDESIAEAARYILIAAAAHKGQPTFDFCFAAQTHAKPLIPLLSQSHCEALRLEYEDLYPHCNHLPLNQEIYTLLCTHAGTVPKKKRFLSFLGK